MGAGSSGEADSEAVCGGGQIERVLGRRRGRGGRSQGSGCCRFRVLAVQIQGEFFRCTQSSVLRNTETASTHQSVS
jgi:hypothetical protein